MSSATKQPEKRVRLQINTAGAWRNVIEFNGADSAEATAVMSHSALLAVVGKATLRICTTDGAQTVLGSWNPDTGWSDFKLINVPGHGLTRIQKGELQQ